MVEFQRIQKANLDLSNFIILEKGEIDRIHNKGKINPIETPYKGMPRRPGGQGDILSGILATLVNWYGFPENREHQSEENLVKVLAGGCEILRLAQERAYRKNFRGTMSNDVIKEIPSVFHDFVLQA